MYGDGSVGKTKRADGRYQGSITIAGKRRYVYAATRAQVRSKLAALRAEGAAPKAPQTVASYLAEWLTDAAPHLKPRTLERYQQIVTYQITPALGDVQLAALEPRDVKRLYTELSKTLAPQTVVHVHRVLHTALQAATREETIRRNPASLVQPPRVPRREERALPPDEVVALLNAARGDRLEALYILGVTTGMREGELLGLRWRDVDLDTGLLTVRYALVALPGELRIMETKTAGSRRAFPLAPFQVRALLRRRDIYNEERQMRGWTEHGIVFPRENGMPLHPTSFRRRFNQLVKAAGLPPHKPHELRHTAATLLHADGVPARIAADLLGHSRVGILLDRYTHTSPALLREAMAAMERRFGGE